jgi:hypothetical protein
MPQNIIRLIANHAHFGKIAVAGAIMSLLLVWFVVLLPSSTLADTANPDTTPTVAQIHVNQNVAVTGDVIFTGLYDIPYATLPTLTADQTFIIRLLDTDGVTELGSVVPYPYSGFKNGYDEGAFSFYFPAGNAILWGTDYTIQIAENPSQFVSPETWNTNIKTSDYTTLTVHADNSADLASQVYSLGTVLQADYNQTLFDTSGNGQTLTGIGEAYFRGAIIGLQNMAPVLFVIQASNTDTSNTVWTTAAFDNYMARFNDTWVGDAMSATGDQFGMSGNMAMGLFVIAPFCLFFLIFSGMKFRTTDPGLVASSVVLEMGAVMGWVPAALFATIFQFMGIYIAYLFFFSRG